MDGIGDKVSVVIAGIIGLAIVAVLVSQRAMTAQVIQSASAGLSSVIGAAVSPITGSNAANTTSGTNAFSSLLGGTGSSSTGAGSSILGGNPLSMLSGGGMGSGGLDFSSIGSLANISSIAGIAGAFA